MERGKVLCILVVVEGTIVYAFAKTPQIVCYKVYVNLLYVKYSFLNLFKRICII
jgi:hypothetical protein